MDASLLFGLAGVVIGGILAAWNARSSDHREARRDALVALARLEALDRGLGGPSESDELQDVLLEARIDLLRGGVPWSYVEVSHRLALAVCAVNQVLRAPGREVKADSETLSKLRHPAFQSSRPLLVGGDIVRQVVAESIERPLWSRLIAPVRVVQLRALLRSLRIVNELTLLSTSIRPPWGQDPFPYLTWPRRRLLRVGVEEHDLAPASMWLRTSHTAWAAGADE